MLMRRFGARGRQREEGKEEEEDGDDGGVVSSMKVTKEFMLLLTNGAAQKKSKPSSSSSASEDKNAPGQKLADTLRKVLEKAQQKGVNIEDAFGHFDKNGDGDITVSELAEGLRGLGLKGATMAEVRKLVAKLDTNGDGSVSYREF